MTTVDLIERAAFAGVVMTVNDAQQLEVSGPRSALASWRPMLSERRNDVVHELLRRRRPSRAELAELRAAVRSTYATAEEAQQGLALALIDVDRALVAYRALAAERAQEGAQRGAEHHR